MKTPRRQHLRSVIHIVLSSVLVSQLDFSQPQPFEATLCRCTVLEPDIDAAIGIELYAHGIGGCQVVPLGYIDIAGIKPHNHAYAAAKHVIRTKGNAFTKLSHFAVYIVCEIILLVKWCPMRQYRER